MCGDGSSIRGFPLPKKSTIEALVSLGATIDFIGCWLALEHNLMERCNLYTHNMDLLFHNISVELCNQPSPNKNENRHYMLLEVVGMLKH